MLTLPIKKKWFDMILSGEKTEEYREIKPYYDSRLKITVFANGKPILTIPKSGVSIIFRNGYKKDSPAIKCLCDVWVGCGKEEWGAEPNKLYYVLKILSVEEVK